MTMRYRVVVPLLSFLHLLVACDAPVGPMIDPSKPQPAPNNNQGQVPVSAPAVPVPKGQSGVVTQPVPVAVKPDPYVAKCFELKCSGKTHCAFDRDTKTVSCVKDACAGVCGYGTICDIKNSVCTTNPLNSPFPAVLKLGACGEGCEFFLLKSSYAGFLLFFDFKPLGKSCFFWYTIKINLVSNHTNT